MEADGAKGLGKAPVNFPRFGDQEYLGGFPGYGANGKLQQAGKERRE